MTTMTEIEALAEQFSKARQELSDRLEVLREEQEAIRKRRMQGIRNALARFSEAHEALLAAVKEGKPLFEKPKTRILHNVRVGWKKAPGKLEIADADATVAAIRKLLPDQVEALVRKRETPIKEALEQLPAAVLKRLGVTVTDDSEAAIVQPVGDALDKLISALLKDEENAAQAEAALAG